MGNKTLIPVIRSWQLVTRQCLLQSARQLGASYRVKKNGNPSILPNGHVGDKNHALWSSHLSPSDFQLFGHLKIHLAGKQFATDANVKEALTSYLQTHYTCFFFFLCRDTTLSVAVEQVLKCQWRLQRSLMCAICFKIAIHTSKSDKVLRVRVFVTLISETSL